MNRAARGARSRGQVLRQSAQAVQVLVFALASLPALAQESDTSAKKLERVEITGSAIKRLENETALPVQVITRDEIVKQGLTTAAEIVGRISAATNNMTDGGSIAYGGFRDQMGMNGANLRGIGVSSTLVLLNGRRMANFASPGDSSGVDLNSIPAAAIQRVEVLLDGASAIYGSDAIGGVINFIHPQGLHRHGTQCQLWEYQRGRGRQTHRLGQRRLWRFQSPGFQRLWRAGHPKNRQPECQSAQVHHRSGHPRAACQICSLAPPSPAI